MKKFFFAAILAATLSGAAYHVITGQKSTPRSAMEMANLEALSDNEGSGQDVKCYCRITNYGIGICTTLGNLTYCGGDPCDSHDGNCRF